MLSPGGALVVDNLLRPDPDEITPFIAAVSADPRMDGVSVDLGHGLQIFVRDAAEA